MNSIKNYLAFNPPQQTDRYFLIAMAYFMGHLFSLSLFYYYTVILAALAFVYQFHLIYDRKPEQCLLAFLNNNVVGLFVFLGIFGSFI